MRKKILISMLLVCSIGTCFGQLISKVNEPIELTGIACRIAGLPEYKEGCIEEYNSDIDTYFHDYRYHDLIEYVIKLRNEDRLGYSAIAGSTMFITIKNGKVILNPQLPVSKLPGLGDQWKDEKTFKKYVKLLNDFYRKSNFRKFYDDHKPLYKQTEANMNAFLTHFNREWFSDFFGVELKDPTVYVALSNGAANYYIMDYESEAGYAIMIGGRQSYSIDYTLPTIIHEICHNYSNPLFYKYWPSMEDAANKIYKDIEEEMWKIAYGSAWESILEWQNNLCTVMYLKDNLTPLAPFFMGDMRDRGFIWLPRSAQFMENFYENRDKYPHFDSFMPQLVDFFNATANDFDRVKFEFEHRHPYVVSIFPAAGSNIMNEDFNEIKITFSQPMNSGCYSIEAIKDDPKITKIPRPESIDAYWKDNYTFVIPIEHTQLEKNKKYGVRLNDNGFISNDCNNIESDYIIYYNTYDN